MFYRKHARVQHDFSAGGRTRQEFRDECDVNILMKRYQRTGVLPGDPASMRYGDFSSLPDFMEAMNTVARANEAFAALPAHVRKRFGNDPGEYVDFVADPKNIDEVRKLGLAKAVEVPSEAPTAPMAGAEPLAAEGA